MQNKNYPIQRTGSQDNERYQINKVLGDVLDTLDRASDWDSAASWGDHRTANYASEEDAILSGVTVPTTIALSYERDTLPNGTDIARIRAQWTRVTNPNFVYDLEIRERDIDAGNTASSPLGTLYSVPIISNTEGGSIAAYESEFKLGKNYQFRIRIRQNRVISPWSNYFDIDTLRDPQAPGGPGGTAPGGSFAFNLTAEAGQASIILKWTAPTSPNLAYYEVRRTAPSPAVSPLAQIGAGNTTYTDAGLEAGITHTYSVRAVSYEGQVTAYSNNASAVPLEVEFTAPPAPTGLTASSKIVTGNTGDQVGKVLVTWDRLVGEDITYDLEIFEVPPVGSPELITSPSIVNPELETEKPHYEFVGQVNDNFSIKVRSRRATNTSDWTSPVTISIIPDSASPGDINTNSITLSPIYQGILLKWDRPLAANYNATKIERKFTAPASAVSNYEEVGEVTRPISFFFDDIGRLDVDSTTKAVTTKVRYRLTPLSSAGQSGASIETAEGTPSNVPEGTISAGQIIARSITAEQIESKTITTEELDVGQITADSAFFGGIQQNISASGEYGAIILKDGPDGPATRDNGEPLQEGDLWLDTRPAEENRPYARRGGTWVAAYTSIDGGNIKTGTIDANRLNIVAIIDENDIATTGDIPEGGNVTIRQNTAPGTRPNGDPLQVGDYWVDTDLGDLPHTWNGSSWVRMYTSIAGGNIITGSITSNELDIVSIIAENDIATTGDIPEGGNVTIRSNSEPTVRPNGDPLEVGDYWVDTDLGDLPHTWDGALWVRMYTSISGGNIITGTIDATKIDVTDLIVKNLRTATSGNRVEITDPSQPGVYLFWVGDGTKDDTAYFWIKENGDVYINKQVFGISDGQLNTGSFSNSNTATGGSTTNTLVATSPDIEVGAGGIKLDANFQFNAVNQTIQTEQGDCTGSGNISGSLRLQRKLAAGSTWTTVDTVSVNGGGSTIWIPDDDPSLAPGICTIRNSTDRIRIFTDTPGAGNYNYRVLWSSWNAPYSDAQVSTNEFKVTYITST